MDTMINKVFNEDCLTGMSRIADGSVDMVLCDLPYGTTQNKWDSIIPFDELWEHYKRIVKPNGAMVFTASQPFTSLLVISNINHYKHCWVWDKKNISNPLNAKIMPLKQHEDIIVFCKGKVIYNPQKTDLDYSREWQQYKGSTNVGKLNIGDKGKTQGKYPKTIIEFSNASQVNKVHPTQKPVALMEYLIRTYTNEDDVVVDNCAGSGTTLVAAINTHRNYIGFELDKGYYDIAVSRIEAAKAEVCPMRLLSVKE